MFAAAVISRHEFQTLHDQVQPSDTTNDPASLPQSTASKNSTAVTPPLDNYAGYYPEANSHCQRLDVCYAYNYASGLVHMNIEKDYQKLADRREIVLLKTQSSGKHIIDFTIDLIIQWGPT
jgi:hypothetical protein